MSNFLLFTLAKRLPVEELLGVAGQKDQRGVTTQMDGLQQGERVEGKLQDLPVPHCLQLKGVVFFEGENKQRVREDKKKVV